MKNSIIKFSIFVFLGLFIASCSTIPTSITKRHYRGGWYVETKGSINKQEIVKNTLPVNKSELNGLTQKNELTEVTNPENNPNSQEQVSIVSENKVKVEPNFIASTNNTVIKDVVKNNKVNHNPINIFPNADNKKLNKIVKKAEKAAPLGSKGGDKNWLVAVLLCFFLGGIGIHRFYLGYTTIGIIQLLTLGGCGVWALIDFIRIIIKDLKPKDGNYID